MSSCVIGIDIGGSHITAAVIDLDKRQIWKDTLCRQMVDSDGPLEEIISSWCKTIEKCIRALPGKEIYLGIAMPGPFDYKKGISYIREQSKFKALYAINVKEALATRLGISTWNIQFLNDAASFLKGEIFSGVARNHQCVYGITLGTGFGSALYKAGVAIDANLWCSPFKEGIAEDYFSTRWFVQRYTDKTGKKVNNVRELAALIDQAVEVKEIFDEFGENFAAFVVDRLLLEDLEMIVFGGSISNSIHLFYPSLQLHLSKHSLSVVVRKSTLHEDAALLGAASCWTKPLPVSTIFPT